jgi:hypothetical protein
MASLRSGPLGPETRQIEENPMLTIVSSVCDCSDLQLDVVGCECGGEPRARMTYAERVAEQDRIADALIERAMDREHRAEMAYYEAEREKDLARGWKWDPSWGDQPADEHVRAYLAHLDKVETILIAA